MSRHTTISSTTDNRSTSTPSNGLSLSSRTLLPARPRLAPSRPGERSRIEQRVRSTLLRLAELRLTIDREVAVRSTNTLRIVRLKRLMLMLKSRLNALTGMAAASRQRAHRARLIRIASAPRFPAGLPLPSQRTV